MFRATSDDDDDDIGAFPLWWDALVNWLASWIDYARAAYQITTESVRNGLQLGPVGIANHRRRRRTAKRNRCNSIPELEGCVVEPSLGSDYGALDLLDENNKNCLAHAYEGKEISAQPLPSIEHQRGEWDRVSIYRELEPAFLNERDYPAGWLVYHPVLRVVTKTEAETYDREVAEKQQEVQLPEQRNETNHALVKSIGDHEHAEEKKDDLSGVETKRLGGSHAKRSATRQQHANMPVLPQPVVAT